MNIPVLLTCAEKGQTLEPCGCGLVTVLCQAHHHWLVLVHWEEKGMPEVGHFITFLPQGPQDFGDLRRMQFQAENPA